MLLPWVSSTKLISLKLTKIKSALKIVHQFSGMGRLLSVATPNLILLTQSHIYICIYVAPEKNVIEPLT